MNHNYLLMHRDTPCAVIAIDSVNGALTEMQIILKEQMPFLGNADERKMKIWWENRAVPGSRREMEKIIRQSGCENSKGYLAKNLALSMTDSYWICPMELELSWKDVSLYKYARTGTQFLPLHRGSSYDPNASLGGEMDKYWDLNGDEPVLVKKAYQNYGQQSLNELFASKLHAEQRANIPFAVYSVDTTEDHAVLSRCKAFTSDRIEFIPAYEVLHSIKQRASRSSFDLYLDACEKQGLNRAEMQHFMDYLILSDFIISNTDEHLYNFGLLRDAHTLELIGPAPIFDSGNSMFFDRSLSGALSRKDLLQLRIHSFHDQEERMLRHISDRSIIDPALLPTPADTEDFYRSHGMPPERAAFIAGSYQNKLELLREFQEGRAISSYRETHPSV